MSDKEVYRIEIPITAEDNTNPALGQAQKRLTRFEQAVKKTEKQIKKLNKTRMQLVISAVDKASAVISYVTQKAGNLAGKTFKVTFRAIDYVTRPLRAIVRMATSAIGLITAGAGAWGGIIKPLGLSGDMEQAQIGFTTMLKSAEKAKVLLSDLEQLANKTPFEFPELRDSAKYMLAFGFQANQIVPMLTDIGDAAAGLSLGADGIDRVTRALGQMKAKGRPQAQELLQLYEAGIPAAQILKEELGLTAEQIANIGEQSLSADKVIQALLKGMQKRYGGMMQAQALTMKGLASTIKDTFQNSLLRRWGDGLREGVTIPMKELVKWIDANPETITRWGEAWKQAGKQVSYWVVDKVDKLKRSVSDLINSRDWKEAQGLGEKFRLAWNKVIEEPFRQWWGSGGSQFVKDAAQNMGSALGGLLGGFLMSALGIAADNKGEQSVFVEAGTTAGSAFLEAFVKAFDADKVTGKLLEAFKNVQVEAGKVAPGGAKPGAGSIFGLALDAWLISKGVGLAKKGSGAFKWLKGLGGAKAATTATTAAAEVAATAVKSTPIYGPNGQILKQVSQQAAETAVKTTTAKTAKKGIGTFLRGAGGKFLGLGGVLLETLQTGGSSEQGIRQQKVQAALAKAGYTNVNEAAAGQKIYDRYRKSPSSLTTAEMSSLKQFDTYRQTMYPGTKSVFGKETPSVPIGVPQTGGNKTITINVEAKPTYQLETAANADDILKIIKAKNKEITDVIGKELATQLEEFLDNATAPRRQGGPKEAI